MYIHCRSQYNDRLSVAVVIFHLVSIATTCTLSSNRKNFTLYLSITIQIIETI